LPEHAARMRDIEKMYKYLIGKLDEGNQLESLGEDG
jgi:hypothetical protein